MNGVHFLGYIGLPRSYSEYKRDNMFIPFNEKLQLFTDEEVKRLDEINMETGGACYREVLSWIMNLLFTAKKFGYIDTIVYNSMSSEVLQLRGAIGQLFDFEDQPIPFVYVHLIHFITLLYLCLFSFFVGTSIGEPHNHYRDIIGLVVILILDMVAIGILEIGRLMSQPYMSDLSDFSVMSYIEGTWNSSRRILSSQRFSVSSLQIEQDLERGRLSIGDKGYPDTAKMVNRLRMNHSSKAFHENEEDDSSLDEDRDKMNYWKNPNRDGLTNGSSLLTSSCSTLCLLSSNLSAPTVMIPNGHSLSPSLSFPTEFSKRHQLSHQPRIYHDAYHPYDDLERPSSLPVMDMSFIATPDGTIDFMEYVVEH